MSKRKDGRPRAVPAQGEQSLPLPQEKLADLKRRLANSRWSWLAAADRQLIFAMLDILAKAQETEQKLQEALRLIEIDPLTGLPNRTLFFDRCNRAIANAKRRHDRLALLFLDLDNFKQINDTLGHTVGDEALKRATQCFVSSVRDADTVSRIGGDEFLILLTEVSQPGDAALVAKKIIAALGRPNRIGEHRLRLTVSIGISIYPDDGDSAELLVEHADAAMYRAKRHGLGGFVFHGEECTDEHSHQPQTLASLKRLVVHYELALAERDREHEQLVSVANTAKALQAEAEHAGRQQKSAMTMVAHELRNPLVPIRMAGELIGRASAQALPRLQRIIEHQVVQLSRLSDDLLDISRASDGKLKIERQRVNLSELIVNAVEAWQPAMDRRSHHFRLQLPAQALEMEGDPVRLRQIFDNLLGNACQYTPEGGDIELSVVATGETTTITLADNGIGISAEALPHIFEPFVQDKQASDGNHAGLGIGLAVVRELVVAHGGEVVASSAGIGRGSQFTVRFPLAVPNRAAD